MVKVKELIERGLELFSRNSVGRLEKFFESAKQENLDISLIDKKYMKFKRTKKKKRFTTIFNYFTFGFSAIGRMAHMAYDAERKEVAANEIPDGWMGLDVGSKSQKINNDVIMSSKTILWNGPLGVFEMSNFAEGTKALGDSIAEATKSGAFSLVGGGDSVAFVKQFGYADKVSYVSTGGGAMLESLEGLELPGVSAINK